MRFPNPLRRLRLGTLLVGLNVGLLLIAIAGVAYAATFVLQQLADDQALARVEQAGASAQQAVAQAGRALTTGAQLLGERPTLLRLLKAGDRDGLTVFLSQFQQTSRLDATAVILDDRIVASSGAALSWETLWAELRHIDGSFIGRLETGALMQAARSPVASQSNAFVVVAAQLDESFAQQLSGEIGLPVTIIDSPFAAADDPLRGLRSQVAATAQPAIARRDEVGAYVAIFPLSAPTGQVVGLVETRLATTGIIESLRQFIAALLGLAAIVAGLAAVVSFGFGLWLGRPLQRLTEAAARIGYGDLSTPIVVRPGGEIGALAATLEDMRDRLLRLTADLRRQQAESSAIITSIVEGVFSVDRERRIRFVNPQMAAMLGIDPHDAPGRFCGDVLNPQGPDGVRPCADHCPIVHARFRSGARAVEHLLLRDGQRRTVIITSAPPSDERQVQVMRDETDVEASRRLRDAVLANVSHEFRTPLSAQLASIELLLDQLPDLTPEQIAELVQRLQRGTLRLTQLVDNLLESVRIEAGEYTIRHDAVAVDEVIEEALEFTRPLLKQNEQDAIVELPYPLPPIRGDARRLTQVFVNLLANALKFAPRGSMIRIGGAVEPETIRLWVEDEGPGMPQPLAGQSLFDRFVRSRGDEPEQGGVGLGLWIVKSIVERHAGRVDAFDGADGRGTRVCVTLPHKTSEVLKTSEV